MKIVKRFHYLAALLHRGRGVAMTDAKHPFSFLLGVVLALGLITRSTLAFAADTSCGIVYVMDASMSAYSMTERN